MYSGKGPKDDDFGPNVQRLIDNGMIINPQNVPQETRDAINGLSDEEIHQLIATYQKIGAPSSRGSGPHYQVF